MPRGNPSLKLAITVDPDIHENILAAAARDGMSVSAWDDHGGARSTAAAGWFGGGRAVGKAARRLHHVPGESVGLSAQRLEAVREGEGTVLDNSRLLFVVPFECVVRDEARQQEGAGGDHRRPGGKLATGRALNYFEAGETRIVSCVACIWAS
jgi:hypothetical protein